jgi:hypothetical protein
LRGGGSALASLSKYVFQAIDLSIAGGAQGPVLVINATESDVLNGKLGELFEAINAKISRRGIDFLGAVIADAKRKF